MKNFTQIPNWIIEDPNLSSQAKVIFFYLLRRYGQKDWTLRAKDIQNKTGVTGGTYTRAIAELKKFGLIIDYTPKSRNATYQVNHKIFEGNTYYGKTKAADNMAVGQSYSTAELPKDIISMLKEVYNPNNHTHKLQNGWTVAVYGKDKVKRVN